MSIQIAAIASRKLQVEAFVPAYQAQPGYQIEASLDNSWRELEGDQARISFLQKATVRARAADGNLYFEAISELEVLCTFTAEHAAQAEQFATHHLAEIAFPYTRQKVGSVVSQAGYPMAPLPALGNATFKPALRLVEGA